ncbi:MAG: ParB/RepB/Spo0J family partition protein [Phycisphaerae bacterium]|nr:ParB/RepB/Spo0J family partition protein [Phycisphaerae bacterium]
MTAATTERMPAELGQVPISIEGLWWVEPSPENRRLYRPIDPDDPDIVKLADSIHERGILEPLIVTRDGFIVSGHRRYAAAKLAGLEKAPVRILPFYKNEEHDRFMHLLRECNRQRFKTFDEVLREEIVSTSPEEAHRFLTEHRKKNARLRIRTLEIGGPKRRAKISKAKRFLLAAVEQVIEELREFWPVSVRQIHYRLLNDPPLVHASKPGRYRNDHRSYKKLDTLLLQAREEGIIPYEVIHDPTRPITLYRVHPGVQAFLREELDGLLKGYYRDFQQSQPRHIELAVEKNTVASVLEPLAAEYCIPMTSGRGFCSKPPLCEMAKRFHKSGKDRLLVLLVTDFDPPGLQIAKDVARSLRDEFGVSRIDAVRAALWDKQVHDLNLSEGWEKAKPKSPGYREFVEQYGNKVYELEAVEPGQLQQIVRDAIDGMLDRAMFNREIDQEASDAAHLHELRQRALFACRGTINEEEEPA